ncbi:MAG: hypothetical protein COB33_009015 [Thiotrichaceae bacterium]|nr:hypothetical protein [Thiotrichaceae bacterium]
MSLLLLVPLNAIANKQSSSPHAHWNTPFQIRDYTFPSFLLLGFAPTPAIPLGKGRHHFSLNYNVVNDF